MDWDTITEFLRHPTIHNDKINYLIGWLSALACFLAAYFTARTVGEKPNLFLATALFGCAWVLVMGAYDSRASLPFTALPDRATDVASFLLVWAGAALGNEREPPLWSSRVHRWLQSGSMWLLFVLVLPSQLTVRLPWITTAQTELVLGEIMTVAGWVSLALGVRAVAGNSAFTVLLAVMVLVEAAGIARTFEIWDIAPGQPRPRLGPAFVYFFAFAKLVLTGVVCGVVLRTFYKTRGT